MKKKVKRVSEVELWKDDADCDNTDIPTKTQKKKRRQETPDTEIPTSREVKSEVPQNKHKKGMQNPMVEDKHEKRIAKQRKKEKMARKKEQKQNPQPSQRPELCLQYLDQWSEDRENWKFNKAKQTWLLRNAFDVKKISDEKFLILMEYLQGLQGKSRATTIAQVEKLLVLFDEDVESKSITCETEGVKIVVERTGYGRVRKVCQSLT